MFRLATLVTLALVAASCVQAPAETSRFVPDTAFRSGDQVEPGLPTDFEMITHCGFKWLGELNSVNWRTDSNPPQEWFDVLGTEPTLRVSVLLTMEPELRIDATAGSSTISYYPSTEPIPACY